MNSALGAVEMLNQPSWFTTYPLWTVAKYSATSPMFVTGNASTQPAFGAANAMSRAGRAASNVIGLIPASNSGGMTAIFTGVGGGAGWSDPDPNGASFQWPFHVMIYDSTLTRADYAGRVPDLWFAAQTRLDGDVTPSSGAIDYMNVGDMWFPSNAVPTL